MRLIYLTGPLVPSEDYADIIRYFMKKASNLFLFSPHLHQEHMITGTLYWDTWAQQNFFMIKKASAMWVLTAENWDRSYPVSQEIEYAESIQRETLYLLPEPKGYVLTDAKPVNTPTPII